MTQQQWLMKVCVWEREKKNYVFCVYNVGWWEKFSQPTYVCHPIYVHLICACACLPLNDGSCRQLGDVVQCSWVQDHSEEGETEGKWLTEATVCICTRKHTSGYPTLTQGKNKHSCTLTRTMWQVHQPTNGRKCHPKYQEKPEQLASNRRN